MACNSGSWWCSHALASTVFTCFYDSLSLSSLWGQGMPPLNDLPRCSGTVGQGPLLGLARIGAAPTHGHTTVIEGRGRGLLSCLESGEGSLVEPENSIGGMA